MSQAFSVTTQILRPIDEVWDVMTDWPACPRWMYGVERMEADGDTVAGTNLTFHARGKDRPSQIVEVDQGRRVLLRSVQGGVTADYTYELASLDDFTTVAVLTADCDTDGFLWGAMSPLIRLMLRRTDSGQLESLKKVVESE